MDLKRHLTSCLASFTLLAIDGSGMDILLTGRPEGFIAGHTHLAALSRVFERQSHPGGAIGLPRSLR